MTSKESAEHAAMVGRTVLDLQDASCRLTKAEERLQAFRGTVQVFSDLGDTWPPSVDQQWPSADDISDVRRAVETARTDVARTRSDLQRIGVDLAKLRIV